MLQNFVNVGAHHHVIKRLMLNFSHNLSFIFFTNISDRIPATLPSRTAHICIYVTWPRAHHLPIVSSCCIKASVPSDPVFVATIPRRSGWHLRVVRLLALYEGVNCSGWSAECSYFHIQWTLCKELFALKRTLNSTWHSSVTLVQIHFHNCRGLSLQLKPNDEPFPLNSDIRKHL
jgi:hypothetical protein